MAIFFWSHGLLAPRLALQKGPVKFQVKSSKREIRNLILCEEGTQSDHKDELNDHLNIESKGYPPQKTPIRKKGKRFVNRFRPYVGIPADGVRESLNLDQRDQNRNEVIYSDTNEFGTLNQQNVPRDQMVSRPQHGTGNPNIQRIRQGEAPRVRIQSDRLGNHASSPGTSDPSTHQDQLNQMLSEDSPLQPTMSIRSSQPTPCTSHQNQGIIIETQRGHTRWDPGPSGHLDCLQTQIPRNVQTYQTTHSSQDIPSSSTEEDPVIRSRDHHSSTNMINQNNRTIGNFQINDSTRRISSYSRNMSSNINNNSLRDSTVRVRTDHLEIGPNHRLRQAYVDLYDVMNVLDVSTDQPSTRVRPETGHQPNTSMNHHDHTRNIGSGSARTFHWPHSQDSWSRRQWLNHLRRYLNRDFNQSQEQRIGIEDLEDLGLLRPD